MLAITAAELTTNLFDPVVGIISYTIILVAVIVHAALIRAKVTTGSNLVLSLTLVPLIRMLSLYMPISIFSPKYWYIIIYPPLLIAAWIAMRRLNYSPEDVGVRKGRLSTQALIALSGLVLGLTEYAILRPPPSIVTQFTTSEIVLGLIALFLGTGLVEEFIFRGVLQKSSQEALGVRWGLIYASYLFAILDIIHFSGGRWLTILDIPFVFAVGMLFGWIVNKTGSLVGVILAHGLTNTMLFVILPAIF